MIEEFAVSLFAQHLGTAHPISPKKLDQAFADLRPFERSENPEQAQRVEGQKPKTQNPAPKTQPDSSRRINEKPDKPTQADLASLKNLFK